MPSRRDCLALACVPLVAPVSGCLSAGPVSGRPTVREESGQTVERTIYTPLSDETADPAFATLVVGRGGGFYLGERKPHQVWIRNGTGKRRDIAVEIAGAPDTDR